MSVLTKFGLRPTPESMKRLVELLLEIASDNKFTCWFDLSVSEKLWSLIIQYLVQYLGDGFQIDFTPKNPKICFTKGATSKISGYLSYSKINYIHEVTMLFSLEQSAIDEILQILCSHHYIKSFMKCTWLIDRSIASSSYSLSTIRETKLAQSYEAIIEFIKISLIYEQAGKYRTESSQTGLISEFGLYYDCNLYKETI